MLSSKSQTSRITEEKSPTRMVDGVKRRAARNPKLVKQKDKPQKLLPSEYRREMNQTTEERLANTHEMHTPRILELLDMSETTHLKVATGDVDQPFFQPYPSEIVFQNYQPYETYEVQLVLRNNDKIPHLLRVIEEDSLYFQVVSPPDVSRKVAPGMAATFIVLFRPQENKDYVHRLICVTEREKFEVPIRSIGARAILDFPDQLVFPVCPVKCLSQKTILVRNIGNGEAKFKLSTKSPFIVKPPAGTLGAEESMQVTVDFRPKKTGDHKQQLMLHYHTGENVYVDLYGAATDISVRLDRNTVLMEKTYITMSNQRRVSIMNRSDSMVHYEWRSFATEEEEEQHRLRIPSEQKEEGEDDEDNMKEFLMECNADPAVRDRLLQLADTFQNRRKSPEINQDSITCNDQYFAIEPQKGDIFPHRTAEINIIFKPQEARMYQHTVYCDVTGREARMPLRIKGEGIGPKVEFSYDLLDMGNIFLGATQVYEVIVSNKGLINASYKLVPPSTALGLLFSFNPAEATLPPGDSQAMEVSFTSNSLGTVCEEFHCTVKGNPQSLSLTFSGCVTGPTFYFSVPELDFGEVSFGFPHTLTCCITNTSLVPMGFVLRVPGDGTGMDSMSNTEQVSQLDRNDWKPWDGTTLRPQEFKLLPSSGSIRALSKINIQVTLCSNTVQEYNLALVVDVDGVGEEILALPIKARCVVPELHLQSRTLQFKHCFLGYPYEQSVRLVNKTKLPACYGLLPQEHEEQPSLLFSTPHPRGVIEPNSTNDISLILVAKKLGDLFHTAYFAILGQKSPQLALFLTCIGKGPSVSLSATELKYGIIPVLTDVPETLLLSNHSPIPAPFLTQMVQNRSPWRVEPPEGEVAPRETLELKVVAHLDDMLPFQDQLKLTIQDGPTLTVSMLAVGNGTTIVTDRPFAPNLDLGTHFSTEPCQYHFKLINKGRRMHVLRWASETFKKTRSAPNRLPRQAKSNTPPLSLPVEAPVFILRPAWVELGPGKSVDMLLEGSCNNPEVVTERLVCFAHIGDQRMKKQIMTVEVTCKFITPVLEVSPQRLNFYIEKIPGMLMNPLFQRLNLKNISTLTFTMELSLAGPFGISSHAFDNLPTMTKTLVLDSGAETNIWIRFDPLYQPGPLSRVFEEVLEVRYTEHPQLDTVPLRAEAHFPNLHFSSHVLDFGCILNHTEVQRQITMTNCSPLPITYRWAFQLDQHQYSIRQCGVSELRLDKKAADRKKDREGRKSLKEDRDGRGKSIRETFTQKPHVTELESTTLDLGPEEVFDILPSFGMLSPGESQLVMFSFFGHADIKGEVLALCEVEEGPTYEITLKGEASVISYSLDTKNINFGPQLFSQVLEAEITLRNTGKVGFDFSVLLDGHQRSSEEPLPGQPFLIPNMGHIEAYAERKLTVCYLPGAPEIFRKTLKLQVAYFETDCIKVRGEGIFPRVCLDLPRDLDEERCRSVLKEARQGVETGSQKGEVPKGDRELCEDCIPTYDAMLQMEVDRLLVKKYATASQESPRDTVLTRSSSCSSHVRKKLSMFVLPEYVLDFGYVIHGTVPAHIVRVTNTAPLAVTFRADCSSLAGTGFFTELDRVKNLPYCETETFEIRFDPRGANLELGQTSAVMPIQVLGGPTVHVRLCALVTMPSLIVSTQTLLFDTVQCGFCQVATVQLHNPSPVPTKWRVLEEEQPKKKMEKHIPFYRKMRELKQPLPPVIFELLPPCGVVYPGEKINVSVRFIPVEEKLYKRKMILAISQSIQQIFLQAQGQGLMPTLKFSPSELLLKPFLPSSDGQEVDVLIQNPCSFPIEFYSLDFDKEYLEEEKILQMVKGYDANSVILLPPRAPGEPLPPELELYRQRNSEEGEQDSDQRTSLVGDLEMNPVSRAISIEVSPEGQVSYNLNGIGIIVHGAPLSGKTGLAVSLAMHYGAACLCLNGVVQEAISCGSSPAAVRARELWEAIIARAVMEMEKKGATPDISADAGQPLSGLSVEAVSRHTAESGQDSKSKVRTSTVSTRNKASTSGSKKNDASSTTALSMVQTLPTSQVQTGQIGAEQPDPTSSFLPDDLLVEILSERLQLSDCYRGVVIDGLETQYCSSLPGALQIVLRAFNNRMHIYAINITDNYIAFKDRERAQREAREALKKEMIEREQRRLLEMDEDVYDALPKDERVLVDLQRLKILRQQRRRDQKRLEKELAMRQEEILEEDPIEKEKKNGKKEANVSGEKTTENQCQMEKNGLEVAKELDKNSQKIDKEETDDEKPDEDNISSQGEPENDQLTEANRVLLARFELYEQSQTQVQHILRYWDRIQGLLLAVFIPEEQPPEPEEVAESQAPATKKSKKELEKERIERERKEKEKLEQKEKEKLSQTSALTESIEDSEREIPEPIPEISIAIKEGKRVNMEKLLSTMKLPPLETILDGLGLGSRGPFIPPPMLFSVVHYPQKRSVASLKHGFTFLEPMSQEEQTQEVELASVTEDKGKKGTGKNDVKRSVKPQRPQTKKGGKNAFMATSPGSDSQAADQGKSGEDVKKGNRKRLTNFRWIVPARGQVNLKIWFESSGPDLLNEKLSFELLGTKRLYELTFKGVCAFPTINTNYEVVFAHCKKVLKPEHGLRKAYIIRSGLYDFGPLLCGKTTDRCKGQTFSENGERLVIHNNSPMTVDVKFTFQRGTAHSTFLMEPYSMVLKPKEKKDLCVWAYPTTTGRLIDGVLCNIKDNQNPVVFNICCTGVQPKLVLDNHILNFGKILLQRRIMRALNLFNPTIFPVTWRLIGLDEIGDEISVSQNMGLIMPETKFSIFVYIEAKRACPVNKKITLTVSDEDFILGTVQSVVIDIIAEPYDVALDITFPKGEDGLNFGTVRSAEESRLSVNLKNKSKHEIAYKFTLEPTSPGMSDLDSMFTITPQKGPLLPNVQPTSIQLTFQYTKEVLIKEQPILRCQVIEPHFTKGEDAVFTIPIKVSAQSLFTKYSVNPANELNFGVLTYKHKETRTITLMNQSSFDIRFTFSRIFKDHPVIEQRKGGMRTLSREIYSANPSAAKNLQYSLTVGMFTLSHYFGHLVPDEQKVISVTCTADKSGHSKEELILEITDRDDCESPGKISYSLMAEVCMPEIENTDMASVFEEHRLCKNNNMLHSEQYRDAKGVYVQDDNKFVFNNVLVAHSSKARIRFTNPGKVPCELSMLIKVVQSKMAPYSSDVFEVTPTRMTIYSHSYAFATITFTPQNMQSYSGLFEAHLEEEAGKSKMVLTFDLMGEGNLPSITTLKPALRNNQGLPVLQFKRLLVGRKQTLPLIIKNTGFVPAKVSADLHDAEAVFKLQTCLGTIYSHISSSEPGKEVGYVANFTLKPEQQAEIDVEFQPKAAHKYDAKIRLVVQDNQFEDTEVKLKGEGYSDIISLEFINSRVPHDQHSTEVNSDLVYFENCHVGHIYHQTFTMTNHSRSEVLRFKWHPDTPVLRFSPQIGHLHAGNTKEMMVSFISEQPIVLNEQVVKCNVCQIIFQHSVDHVPDWDDRHHTIKWVDVDTQSPTKKKVKETDPEPANSPLEVTSRELELRISANCDYAKFKCKTDPIHFEDTMLFQTRVYKWNMTNCGTVELEYSWHVMMEASRDSRGSTPRSTSGIQDLRPASSLDSASALLLGNPDLVPFSVEPSMGLIHPGDEQTFLIRFLPLKVTEYQAKLVCSIPNVKDEQCPVIEMKGRSLLPFCHIELDDSEAILSVARSDPELPPKTRKDSRTRVIEFRSVGIGKSICKEFGVVNPTNKQYSLQWICEDFEPKPFTCLTPKGSIQPAKKALISFKFMPQTLDLIESVWTLSIEELQVSLPFLLVGLAKEPLVYIDRSFLNLNKQFIGYKTYETVYLVNKEKQSFYFAVEETSRHSKDTIDSLFLEPMEGKILAGDKFPVVISFTPTQEGLASFNLIITVMGKVQPLSLNVKADRFSMNTCVQCESPDGSITELSPNVIHTIDFNEVMLPDQSTRVFVVSNHGRLIMTVQYELTGPERLERHLQLGSKKAEVPIGGQTRCVLRFTPQQKCNLKDMSFSIKVKNGPVFTCSLLGSALAPTLEFSFLKHNFGIRFIYATGMVPATQKLCISNKEDREISVDCLFTNTPYLEITFMPEVLNPGESMEITFTFYPREPMQYHEKVIFKINKCIEQTVEILGQGLEMKIAVQDPKHKILQLGALQLGQSRRKIVPIINNSYSSLTFSLLFSPYVKALLNSKVLSVMPHSEVTVQGQGGKCALEILFSPQQHMTLFSEELQIKCLEAVFPLLVLKGCCQGLEITLDQNVLAFGAVVKHCQATRRIVLQNTGNIGTRFLWNVGSFAPEIQIVPDKGYIRAGTEVPLEVTFAPVEVNPEVNYNKIQCIIDEGKPVILSVSGSCIDPTPVSEVVNFVCPVRDACTQSLTLSNPTNQLWILKPIIEGEYWSASPSLVIKPNQQEKAYEVTYKPMVMTKSRKKHMGSVFIPNFPDGLGTLYILHGLAEPPRAVATITREVPCWTTYTEMLPVQNWLSKPQRFRAEMMIKLEQTETRQYDMRQYEHSDGTLSLSGMDYVEVPAMEKREYKLSFISYKLGQYNGKVTLKNEATGEYLFYDFVFSTKPPGDISSVKAVSTVRQVTSTCVKLNNPLPSEQEFTATCSNADITIPNPKVQVPAHSTAILMFEFQPLHKGESTAQLMLSNSELCPFYYKLLLHGLPPSSEKPLFFRAPLGSSHQLSARFINYTRDRSVYSCKTDCPDFIVEKTLKALTSPLGGIEVSLPISFEPSKLGEQRGLLTLFSEQGGEYVFPLYGTCVFPKAQGPLSISSGSKTIISFKNVFQQTTTFTFHVDNPAFTVKGMGTLEPRKSHDIQVTFENPAGSKSPLIGKLTISCPYSAGPGQAITWTYYLKGVASDAPRKEK